MTELTLKIKVLFTLVCFFIFSYKVGNTQDITTGLVAHYKFEETSGTTVADETGAHNGTMINISSADKGVSGKIGKALKFNGTGYVKINNHSGIPNPNAFTLSAWVKPTVLSGSKAILSKVTPGRAFDFAFSGTNRLHVHFHNGSYRICNRIDPNSTNQWIHVVATWGNHTWKIYYNKNLESTCPFSGAPPTNCTRMDIGSMNHTSEKFIGLIDEVRIYNRALTAADVTALYNYTGGSQQQLSGGSISPASKTIASGQSPGTISNGTSASGGSGSYSYRWYKSTNSGSPWYYISGATSTSYTPPTLTQSTWYKRKVTSGGETAYSNISKITVTTGGGAVSSVNGYTGSVVLNLSKTQSGTNRTINISGTGTGITFNVADNDNNSNNEIQTLSISGNNLYLSNGGGTVTLPSSGGTSDNLGNHIATQNIKLNGKWLSGDGGNEGIYINNSGNVGVGTNVLGSYKLSVHGNIRAEEVVVEAGWADYVFKKDYKLKTLKEVEEFINANKHLPDVPSEKEVQKNGIRLAETNAMLLRKIEELTLYLIEQQKEIEKLINKIEVKQNSKK